MFKVSLLPDNYRRHLENKLKIDLISRVALVVLVCLLIVYIGIFIRGKILESKLEEINRKNSQVEAQFPALQEYQKIYNDLVSAKKMVESITPKDTEAVEFFTLISNQTPDYVQITEIDLENWFTAGICTLTCKVQDYKDVQDYKALFETEEMKKTVKLVQITKIERTVATDGKKSVTFTLALSMSNAVTVATESPKYVEVTDKKGETVTNDDGEVKTEVSTTKKGSSGDKDKDKDTDTDKDTSTTAKED